MGIRIAIVVPCCRATPIRIVCIRGVHGNGNNFWATSVNGSGNGNNVMGTGMTHNVRCPVLHRNMQ